MAATAGAEAPVKYFNTGRGPELRILDIGHETHMAAVNPDTAFWSLIAKDSLASALSDGRLLASFEKAKAEFASEMEAIRFGLKPSAVYFNPTDRCNLNCRYCYIPEETRRGGAHMPADRLVEALDRLKEYFKSTMPEGRKPQIIFHGAEPLANKEAVFAGISAHRDSFDFGIQTNATLLDDNAIDFLKSNNVGVGISIDGPDARTGDALRLDWAGKGHFDEAAAAIAKLKDHVGFNVICTVSSANMERLPDVVDFFHAAGVKVCMLNILRCTQERSRSVKPGDAAAASHYIRALDRSWELFLETGRKLIVANFANIILAIVAPSARRLMCDISPCGGGRCFFAVAANGDLFPCSEFVGLPEFKGGNLFTDRIPDVLETEAFRKVSRRLVERISPCAGCAIRHFCGAPCPAEAYSMHGKDIDTPGAFCEFYEEQVRHAFRLIADGRENDFLYDNWDKGMSTVFQA